MARTLVIWCMLVLVAAGSAPGADPWVGQKVYWKDSAVAKVGNLVVDVTKIPFPARVGDVNGEWLWLGRAWVRKSDVMNVAEAFDYYVEEVRRNPGSASAWRCRASVWKQRGELQNAIKDYDEAIRLDPKDAAAYNNRGIVKHALKDYSGAIADYGEAIRLDPKEAMTYNNRGVAKDDLKDYSGAIADYNEAIRLDPKYAGAYSSRGSAKLGQQEFLGAIADYDEAIRLDPKFKNALNNKAFLLATCADEQVRDAAAALSTAEAALALVPKDGYAQSAKACALALAGNYDEAIIWQEKAQADTAWLEDDGLDGGAHAEARITAWKAKTLWLSTPRDEGK